MSLSKKKYIYMSFNKSFHWVFMSIGLGDIDIISILLCCGLVWFASVGKMKTANQTKPYGFVKKWSDISKLNAVFSGFGLGWFGLRFFYWIGSVSNTPSVRGVGHESLNDYHVLVLKNYINKWWVHVKLI